MVHAEGDLETVRGQAPLTRQPGVVDQDVEILSLAM